MEGPVETTRDLATRAYQSYQYDQVLEAETFWKDIRVHLAERGALETKRTAEKSADMPAHEDPAS